MNGSKHCWSAYLLPPPLPTPQFITHQHENDLHDLLCPDGSHGLHKPGAPPPPTNFPSTNHSNIPLKFPPPPMTCCTHADSSCKLHKARFPPPDLPPHPQSQTTMIHILTSSMTCCVHADSSCKLHKARQLPSPSHPPPPPHRITENHILTSSMTCCVQADSSCSPRSARLVSSLFSWSLRGFSREVVVDCTHASNSNTHGHQDSKHITCTHYKNKTKLASIIAVK